MARSPMRQRSRVLQIAGPRYDPCGQPHAVREVDSLRACRTRITTPDARTHPPRRNIYSFFK